MDVIVLGNATLDILCYPINDVPRYDSLAFEQAVVTPGGCGSNIAIGLSALGISTTLIASIGNDDAGSLVRSYWQKWGIDLNHLKTSDNISTAVSVGLVDSNFQPRFIHTTGANRLLTVDDLDLPVLQYAGARVIVISGFFVLPGLLDVRLASTIKNARNMGLLCVLDVVHSPLMHNPEILWQILPDLDIFLCNEMEGSRITNTKNIQNTLDELLNRGAKTVIIKLGKEGCILAEHDRRQLIPGVKVERVLDTTGAGDAFAAGLVAALIRGKDLVTACYDGNKAGAKVVTQFGAVAAWDRPSI